VKRKALSAYHPAAPDLKLSTGGRCRFVLPGRSGRYLFWGLAISSMAAALRWRAVGKCASQQDTLQKYSFTRPELQVETEHRQYLAFIAMGFLHMEQTAKPAGVGMDGRDDTRLTREVSGLVWG
jgi:hypothetical protein